MVCYWVMVQISWVSVAASPACLSSSAFLVNMTPFETSPTQCISFEKLLSFWEDYLGRLLTHIKFMIVLAEGTNYLLWVSIGYSVSRFLLRLSCKGSHSEVPLVSWIELWSSRFNFVLGLFCLQCLWGRHRIACYSCLLSHKPAKFCEGVISSLGLFPIHSKCLAVFLQFISCYPLINNSAPSYYQVVWEFLNNLLVLVWIIKNIQILDGVHCIAVFQEVREFP